VGQVEEHFPFVITVELIYSPEAQLATHDVPSELTNLAVVGQVVEHFPFVITVESIYCPEEQLATQ
jgi:hypothetical protein